MESLHADQDGSGAVGCVDARLKQDASLIPFKGPLAWLTLISSAIEST